MGSHSRSTIKTDISSDAQSGDPPFIKAIESYQVGVYSLDIVAPIPAMLSRSVYLYPSVGVVLQVKALYMFANLIPGGLVNTHDLEVLAPGNIPILFGSSPFNGDLGYQYRRWYPAAVIQQPGTEVSQGLALESLIADSNTVITFTYYNWTIADQNSDVIIDVVTREGVF